MSNSEQHKQIVKKLLDAKAVDFAAVGKIVAEVGPSLSLADEPGDWFCGTNRIFFHIFKVPGPRGPVDNLPDLALKAPELQR
jgi:hypothetical protein